VRLVDAADSHAYSEGVYYRYERWLQSLESRLGAMVGVDGAMYAIRRECFQAPSPAIILDDFVISMTAARLGYRVLYDAEARATEQGTLTSREEYRRKVRIVAGGIQALKCREGLPKWRQPLLLFCYVSHKLLRWLLPCFLVLMFLASAVLAQAPFYRFVFIGHLLFGLLAAGYGVGVLGLRGHRWCGIPYYFCLVNGAALLGLWKGLWGMQAVTWQRTSR
jgi:cellulose synthase/poly-beta-1,6-N-acetylglucosamine synthase-like glycosyltransferase